MNTRNRPGGLWEAEASKTLDRDAAGRACLSAVGQTTPSRPVEGVWWIAGSDRSGKAAHGWGAVRDDEESRKAVAAAAWSTFSRVCLRPTLTVLHRKTEGGGRNPEEWFEEAWAIARAAVLKGPVPVAIARFDGDRPHIYLFHDISVDASAFAEAATVQRRQK